VAKQKMAAACPLEGLIGGQRDSASSPPISVDTAVTYFTSYFYEYELSNMTELIDPHHVNWHILITMSDVITVAK